MIALKILSDMSSKRHRRRYSKTIRYCFFLGILIGFISLWSENLALLISCSISVLFLVLALYYYLLRGYLISFPSLNVLWTDTDKFRDLFSYIGLTAGVIGIFYTVFSIVLPPFFSLSNNHFVALSFGAISILSSLLFSTITIPKYGILYSLIYNFESADRSKEFSINNKEIPKIVEETSFTKTEIVDALETLVRKDMSSKVSFGFGKVKYKITEEGERFLESHWYQLRTEIMKEAEKIQKSLIYLRRELKKPKISIKKQLKELKKLKNSLDEIRNEYGRLLSREWCLEVNKEINIIEKYLKDLESREY